MGDTDIAQIQILEIILDRLYYYKCNITCCNVTDLTHLQGGPKKRVFSKNENRPWWGFFEKKIHDQ